MKGENINKFIIILKNQNSIISFLLNNTNKKI